MYYDWPLGTLIQSKVIKYNSTAINSAFTNIILLIFYGHSHRGINLALFL